MNSTTGGSSSGLPAPDAVEDDGVVEHLRARAPAGPLLERLPRTLGQRDHERRLLERVAHERGARRRNDRGSRRSDRRGCGGRREPSSSRLLEVPDLPEEREPVRDVDVHEVGALPKRMEERALGLDHLDRLAGPPALADRPDVDHLDALERLGREPRLGDGRDAAHHVERGAEHEHLLRPGHEAALSTAVSDLTPRGIAVAALAWPPPPPTVSSRSPSARSWPRAHWCARRTARSRYHATRTSPCTRCDTRIGKASRSSAWKCTSWLFASAGLDHRSSSFGLREEHLDLFETEVLAGARRFDQREHLFDGPRVPHLVAELEHRGELLRGVCFAGAEHVLTVTGTDELDVAEPAHGEDHEEPDGDEHDRRQAIVAVDDDERDDPEERAGTGEEEHRLLLRQALPKQDVVHVVLVGRERRIARSAAAARRPCRGRRSARRAR